MGVDQYHEPPADLSPETRTVARVLTSLREEADAIGWYEQRISVEQDPEAGAIMHEVKHFGMDLEFLLRRRPQWQDILQGIHFSAGHIVEEGEAAEEA